MARIIMSSYLIRFPVGGYMSWMLQWLAGFQRLGHEIFFVEKSGWPHSCFNPVTSLTSDDCSYGTAMLHELLGCFGLQENWCFVDAAGKYHGMTRERVEDVFQSADLFIDHMRECEWAEEATKVAIRALIDGEPGFTQMRMERNRLLGKTESEFDRYFSVGLNLGTPACSGPTGGQQWHPIFDPVVVDLFPYAPPAPGAPFTTVMSWQTHQPIRFNGKTYGQKDMEFPKFLDLPARIEVPLELAITGETMPVEELTENGWRLRDSHLVTRSFDSWRDYIRDSKGEFSVCKNVFVAINSGFFSDRSAVYLASGRPVVMQETGFSAHLPCGCGLFAVKTAEEAAAAIEEIESDYERHAKGAREVALEHLEATKVLAKFLVDVGI